MSVVNGAREPAKTPGHVGEPSSTQRGDPSRSSSELDPENAFDSETPPPGGSGEWLQQYAWALEDGQLDEAAYLLPWILARGEDWAVVQAGELTAEQIAKVQEGKRLAAELIRIYHLLGPRFPQNHVVHSIFLRRFQEHTATLRPSGSSLTTAIAIQRVLSIFEQSLSGFGSFEELRASLDLLIEQSRTAEQQEKEKKLEKLRSKGQLQEALELCQELVETYHSPLATEMLPALLAESQVRTAGEEARSGGKSAHSKQNNAWAWPEYKIEIPPNNVTPFPIKKVESQKPTAEARRAAWDRTFDAPPPPPSEEMPKPSGGARGGSVARASASAAHLMSVSDLADDPYAFHRGQMAPESVDESLPDLRLLPQLEQDEVPGDEIVAATIEIPWETAEAKPHEITGAPHPGPSSALQHELGRDASAEAQRAIPHKGRETTLHEVSGATLLGTTEPLEDDARTLDLGRGPVKEGATISPGSLQSQIPRIVSGLVAMILVSLAVWGIVQNQEGTQDPEDAASDEGVSEDGMIQNKAFEAPLPPPAPTPMAVPNGPPATLSLDVSPSDMLELYLNGILQTSGTIDGLTVPSGKHTIEIYREKYLKYESVIELKPDQDLKLRVVLERAPTLTVDVEPRTDSEIWLDNKLMIRGANLDAFIIDPGKHKLEVSHDEYQTHLEEFQVEAGDKKELKLTLERRRD